MPYYWCRLTFDDDGNIIKRKALKYCETEQELVQMLRNLVAEHYFENLEESLNILEKHEKSGNYHWHSNIRRNYRLISDGMVRRKYAGKYYFSVICDPKVAGCENNWKQKKIRHQYEWHMKRHQDRYRFTEKKSEQKGENYE